MLNDCCNFLSAASKSVKKTVCVFGFSLIVLATPSFAGSQPSPSPSPTPDLSAIPQMPLQEAKKNASQNYQIGDRIDLLVEIKAPGLENGDRLQLKLPEGSSKLEDQGWYIDPSSQFLGGMFRFIASPIQVGSLTLPTLLISKEDQSVIGRTAPFSIQVVGPEKRENAQTPELLEITQSPLPVKYWIIFSVFALLIMIGASYLVYRFLKRRSKKPKTLPRTTIEPDHLAALRKINSLYQSFPYRMDNLKPVAFGLSETLKEFFSKRFKVDSIEATTDEMIELLRKEAISGESLREIQSLFQDLDLIKFTTKENYSNFDEQRYLDIKVKAQLIIQKWALLVKEGAAP